MHFDPTFTALFNACDSLIANAGVGAGAEMAPALLSRIEDAHQTHAAERARFEQMLSGLKRVAAAEELIGKIRAAFHRRIEGLRLLEVSLVGEGGDLAQGSDLDWADPIDEGGKILIEPVDALLAMEEGQAGLAQYLPLLMRLDAQTRFSPYPPLNEVIQAGLNVLAGNDAPQTLAARMPDLAGGVLALERSWFDLAEVSPVAREASFRFMAVSARLREGVGAVQVWLDETAQGRSYPPNLKVGLHLLGEASYELHALVADVRAAAPTRHGAALEMERLALRLAQAESFDDERVVEALERARFALGALDSDMEALQAAFLPEHVKGAWLPRLVECVVAVNDALASAFADAVNLGPAQDAMAAYEEAYAAAQAEAEALSPDLSAAPRFAQMRDIIAGVYHGVVPEMYLRTLIEAFAQSLDEAASLELAPEALDIVTVQAEALALLRGYLETGERAVLPEAWHAIQETVMATLAMAREVEAQEREARRAVVCLKCGCENGAGVTHCVHCSAFIPFARGGGSHASEFAWSYDAAAAPAVRVPAHVTRLQELVEAWHAEGAVPPDLPPFLDRLLSSAATARRAIEGTLSRTAPENREAAEHFLALTARFQEGLRQIQSALKVAPGLALSGLEEVTAAAEGLAPFQGSAGRG